MNILRYIKGLLNKRSDIIYYCLIAVIVGLCALYRFYQPIMSGSLTQFDVFDWAGRSREILMMGNMSQPTTLWLFPLVNAGISKFLSINIFYVYLYAGAILSTLNLIILYGISKQLWKERYIRLLPLILYALTSQLLARSINYLPETMSYSFGLLLIYLYLKLVYSRNPWWILPITIVNYLYFHLHQSGLNFLFFSIVVIFLYIVFIVKKSWKLKLLVFLVIITGVIVIFLSNSNLRNQIVFFLEGNNSNISEFHANAIPLNQLVDNFPVVYLVMFLIGIVSILFLIFQSASINHKIAWVIISIVTIFYFCFLYIFPNLNIYSLTPWRFYTWFILYAILLISAGIHSTLIFLRKVFSFPLLISISLLFVISTHGTVIPDNMYTANLSTLNAMQRLPISEKSSIITTNANYLQASYALKGKDVTIFQAGENVFKADSSQTAYNLLGAFPKNGQIYVVISLFQLKQRPQFIDYWRNSAIFDMKLSLFDNSKYFTNIYQDENIIAYQLNDQQLK